MLGKFFLQLLSYFSIPNFLTSKFSLQHAFPVSLCLPVFVESDLTPKLMNLDCCGFERRPTLAKLSS